MKTIFLIPLILATSCAYLDTATKNVDVTDPTTSKQVLGVVEQGNPLVLMGERQIEYERVVVYGTDVSTDSTKIKYTLSKNTMSNLFSAAAGVIAGMTVK